MTLLTPRMLTPHGRLKARLIPLSQLKYHLTSLDIDPAYFWRYHTPQEDPDACMVWHLNGQPQPDKYKQFDLEVKGKYIKSWSATWVAWSMETGEPWPEELEARHFHCNTPGCASTRHFRPDEHQPNMYDRIVVREGRRRRIQKHIRTVLIMYERAWAGLADEHYKHIHPKLLDIRNNLTKRQYMRILRQAGIID